MNKIWIVLGFLAAFAVVGHAESPSSWEYEEYEEEADKEYQNHKEVNDYHNKPSDVVDLDAAGFKELIDNADIAYDEAYVELIDRFNNGTVDDFDTEPQNKNNDRDDIDDYQIEDNRSEVKDDTQDSDELLDNVDDIDMEERESNLEEEAIRIADRNSKEKEDDQHPDDYDEELLEEEASEDVAENIPVDSSSSKPLRAEENEESKSVLDEEEYENIIDDEDVDFDSKQAVENTKLLMNTTKNFDEGVADDKLVGSDANHNDNIEDFIDETKKILEETKEAFDEEINMDEEENDDNSDVEEGADSSFENKFSTVKDKIDDEKSNDNEEDDTAIGNGGITTNRNLEDHADSSFDDKSDATSENENLDDDTVAEAYSDLMDDLTQLRETWMKLKGDVNDADLSEENLPGFDELDTKPADMAKEVEERDHKVIDDSDLSELPEDLSEEEFDDDDINEMDGVEEDEDEKEFELELPKEEIQEDLDSMSSSVEKSDKNKLIKYVDDALIANDGADISKNDVKSSTSTMTQTTVTVQQDMVRPPPLLDIPILDNIFAKEEVKKPVGPIRIYLYLEKPVILTSPNYPDPYPSDAFIDWLLEGMGRGIEFNITDFAVNSNEGDYVMINPGSEDTSSDGIILSHHLSSSRSFRFLDVDRVFIRFEAKGKSNRFPGFRFSVQLIDPLPEEDTSEPESQPIGYPHSTLTLNLGGVTLDEFLHIQEAFRQIVADMATMYIEANQIEPGLNTTLEVTQITSTALCFHNWPQFERCAEVRFGVPLQYDDEEKLPRLHEDDLRDMWFTYSKENPFALRLQRLGITDFQVPNDNNVLMVWLILAAGVVISMAMLAFALWRYSCFEDYTRMPSFSDTESVNEKKTLDLYPTPHQSLPPLYSHSEYKWGEAKYDDSTRVDMSGYANRSYARTDDYDFDSEEEVAVPARDRYTTDV